MIVVNCVFVYYFFTIAGQLHCRNGNDQEEGAW